MLIGTSQDDERKGGEVFYLLLLLLLLLLLYLYLYLYLYFDCHPSPEAEDLRLPLQLPLLLTPRDFPSWAKHHIRLTIP